MNLLDGLVVNARFGLRQPREDLCGAILNAVAQPGVMDDSQDVAEMPERMLFRGLYAGMHGADACAIHRNKIDLPGAHAKQPELFCQRARVSAGTDERAED